MLVYGDPKFEAPLDVLYRQLYARTRTVLEHPTDLDQLRALLIVCGQVEQGAHDALESSGQRDGAEAPVKLLHTATTHAAEAFYSLAHKELGLLPPPLVEAPTALRQLLRCLDHVGRLPYRVAAVKLPEGFSFHAMFPEQYAAAAGQWMADHADQQPTNAVVLGIRSIGTTLAAVVATVLRAGGWQVQSLTVRPHGHPYARTVDLGDTVFGPGALGLVVDEGPGISGSSMAAAAAALVKAGIRPEHIAFLPGHSNEPGGAGSPEVKSWWQAARRYVSSSEALRFGRLALPQALAAALGLRPKRIDNVSGGVWRQFVYTDKEEWPAICNHFERVKYLCTADDGRRVLFKFLGLAANSPVLEGTAEEATALLHMRAARDLAPRVLGTAFGFVATEWLEGAPLTGTAPSSDIAVTLGTYIARTAGPELSATEMAAATERLAEMIYVNSIEVCGMRVADDARRLRPSTGCPRASYGDGHLQPYEWIRTADGGIRKVDGVGHDCDHTLVGRQPTAWDIAGAISEWQLGPRAAKHLLDAYIAAGGQTIDAQSLAFYRTAYLAFRAGQCWLAAQMHDPYERDRLLAAYAGYRQQLFEQVS